MIQYSSSLILRPSSLIHLFALASLIFISGCAGLGPTGSQPNTQEINVAAAANLSDAFTELGKQFTSQTGIRVVYSFGATAELAQQIENGAPFDVYAAADVEHVEKLNRSGFLVSGTQALYARGRLVLWTPPESRLSLSRIEEVARQDVERVAIAKPDVAPYGRATVETLRALNLWANVEPKIIYGQNVSQVKQYAATGNADVAFIPLSLVHPGEGHYIEVDERLHQPIDQALGIIKASSKQEAAQRFAAFILSPQGQSLLEHYGYRKSSDR